MCGIYLRHNSLCIMILKPFRQLSSWARVVLAGLLESKNLLLDFSLKSGKAIISSPCIFGLSVSYPMYPFHYNLIIQCLLMVFMYTLIHIETNTTAYYCLVSLQWTAYFVLWGEKAGGSLLYSNSYLWVNRRNCFQMQ